MWGGVEAGWGARHDKKAVNNAEIKHITNIFKINYFLRSIIMIRVGCNTYCLCQAYSGVAGCPVEIEGSDDEIEAGLLGNF